VNSRVNSKKGGQNKKNTRLNKTKGSKSERGVLQKRKDASEHASKNRESPPSPRQGGGFTKGGINLRQDQGGGVGTNGKRQDREWFNQQRRKG